MKYAWDTSASIKKKNGVTHFLTETLSSRCVSPSQKYRCAHLHPRNHHKPSRKKTEDFGSSASYPLEPLLFRRRRLLRRELLDEVEKEAPPPVDITIIITIIVVVVVVVVIIVVVASSWLCQ